MSLQDSQINQIRSKIDQFPPKLRKNRKVELRWGNGYYEVMNKAVFSNELLPYMPSEPPASIKEDVDKTGYVCKQCRDCFRFLSSIEDHTSRRSWVLGYWCQSCFTTKCTHVAKDEPMCSACRNVEASKHAYLAEKGLRRNLKKAVTRVFYNQCQFFAHLRMHGISMVDLSEVMLMPLPGGTMRVDYGQLDKLCRALMETMFIRGTHIMDWLRELNVTSNRFNELLNWMESKKKTPITDIIARYSENCLNPTDLAKRTRKDSLEGHGEDGKITGKADSNDSRSNEKDPLAEDNDSPNDIAFVDCGPTPSHVVLSEFPEVNANEDSGNGQTVERAKSLWRSFSQQYDKQKEKNRDIAPKKIEERVESSSSSSLSSSLPTATINNPATPRVLTIRSPKNLSLSTIMKHLPIDEVSKKNIIVVTDESGVESSLSPVIDSTAVKNSSQLVPLELKSKEKTLNSMLEVKTSEKNNSTIGSLASNADTHPRGIPLITKSQSFSEQMSLHGRIVFQNGRKYIIRHVPKTKSGSILHESIVKKFRNPPPLIAPISGTKIPLLPKPAPLTKITRISTIQQSQKPVSIGDNSRQLKISAKVANSSAFSLSAINANLTSQNSKARITKLQKTLMIKCREALMSDLHRSTRHELESHIKHLKGINERYAKVMNFKNDAVLTNNAKAIASFENVAKFVLLPGRPSQDRADQDIFERITREWETRIKDTDKQRACDTCGKRVKPSSYIVGMSIPAIDETIYCHCYNSICHLCDANQGSLIQLKAHVKWHKREKPYMCPSCFIVFTSYVELEIHVWTSCFHPMVRYIYGCGVCDIEGILDMESIAQHFLLLHTRRKVICAECKMEYSGTAPTYTDYMRHFSQHHREIENITEPKRLLVCNLKQCIIRPELFRAHLSDHIGVMKWIYYKCPFCDTITQSPGKNKSTIREHLVENHLERMHEIVSNESLERIIDGIKLTATNITAIADETGQMCQVLNADPTGPKILDARTITPATFELGTESFVESTAIDIGTKLPKILEVRSGAVEEFESDEMRINDFELEILAVKSLADNSFDSPSIESETSRLVSRENSDELSILTTDTTEAISMRMNSSIIGESIDCENSSNSHDDVTIVSMNSKIDDSERENSLCLLESYNDNHDNSMNNDTVAPHIKELLTTKNMSQRPWRIALNSPIDVEIEPIVYNCHLCGELINTSRSVIKNHFETRHSSDYEIFDVSPNIPRVKINNPDNDYRHESNGNEKKRKVDSSPPSAGPKRRKRWGPKKHVDRPGSPSLGICVKPEPVQEIEGSYRCKKCDCLFEDRSILRNHIAMQHRIKGQYLVCLECGENFVVAPSLQMHLKALHGIQDPIAYLAKNTEYAPEILDDTEEDEKATESNQCYVCMAVFEDKLALDKHIRVHGMAFLRRKRFEAQKALKSCAKINNLTEPSPKIGSIDEKSNDDGKSVKKNFDRYGNDATAINDERSNKNQMRNITTIMEIEKIEPFPMT